VAGNFLYFTMRHYPSQKVEWWRTDGTSLEQVHGIYDDFGYSSTLGEYFGYDGRFYYDGQFIYFAGNDSLHREEPWVLDPTMIGISSVKNFPEVKIFPNPTTDYFTITFSSSEKNLKVKIFNILGQEMKNIPVEEKPELEIRRENLPSGFYSVIVSDRDQSILYSGRVIFE